MKVIDDQTNGGIRKPARRRPKGRRARKPEHRRDQPRNASGDKQKQGDEKELLTLRGPKLLEKHQREWEEHWFGVSPSRISVSNKASAVCAREPVGVCTNGVEKSSDRGGKSPHGSQLSGFQVRDAAARLLGDVYLLFFVYVAEE